MRRVICALVWAALFGAAAGEAGAATNGQWVVVDSAGGSETLITLNPITRSDLGRGERRIYTAAADHQIDAPQWSPDGNRIAFAESAPGDSRILVYDVASERVTEVAAAGAAPSWSADGTRLAFVRGSQLVTRLADGSGEQVLPVDATGVRDVAWSPDGDLLALWVGAHIELATTDGELRAAVGESAVGGAAWSPDARSLVYSRAFPGMPDSVLYRISTISALEGQLPFARGAAGTDLEPEVSPNGLELVYTHRVATGSPSLEVIVPGGFTTGGLRNTLVPSEADWQPCVAGVTTACTSVTPLPPAPAPPNCPASTPITTVAGRQAVVQPDCPGALRYEVVSQPAHGSVAVAGSIRTLVYRPAATFTGEDSFTYRATDVRGNASAVSRVVITVVPKPLKPAAPKLAVRGAPRLDRRGRVALRGTCDRACVVKLRVRIKLNTGRVVDGRSITASAPAGGHVSVRLKRGKVPARRRIVSVRVIGRLRGPDGRARAFTQTVRR